MPLLALGLVACDSDGDGISNKDELDLGTDPDLADTDGDGMISFPEFLQLLRGSLRIAPAWQARYRTRCFSPFPTSADSKLDT